MQTDLCDPRRGRKTRTERRAAAPRQPPCPCRNAPWRREARPRQTETGSTGPTTTATKRTRRRRVGQRMTHLRLRSLRDPFLRSPSLWVNIALPSRLQLSSSLRERGGVDAPDDVEVGRLDVHPRLCARLDKVAPHLPRARLTLLLGHLSLVRLVGLVADEDDGDRVRVLDADDLRLEPLDPFKRRAGGDGVDQDEALALPVVSSSVFAR